METLIFCNSLVRAMIWHIEWPVSKSQFHYFTFTKLLNLSTSVFSPVRHCIVLETRDLKHSINEATIKVHIFNKAKGINLELKSLFWNSCRYKYNLTGFLLPCKTHTHLKPAAFARHNIPNTNWHCLKSYLISYFCLKENSEDTIG